MTRTQTLAVLGLLLTISFVGLGRDLWTPDEPREAEVAREMSLAPSVVPSLDGTIFVEKPPLYYWTVAGVFRLLGGPSAAAARAVSGAASFLTLTLLFFWGRREFSAEVGLAAAVMLATSEQFAVSSHWVLIDPLLMLFTTVALWSSSTLILGRGTRATLGVFYGALALALWTKGLIGPVLIGVGVLAYAAARRSIEPLRRLRPLLGTFVVLIATGVLVSLIAREAGGGAVREWLWVNHAERFVAPDGTGHDEPWHYYLRNVPVAVFPWWVPCAALLRPRTWRSGRVNELNVYLGVAVLAMLVLLSAAATKRATYLLPVLPALFLLLAATSVDWWRKPALDRVGGGAWWLQVALVVSFAALPTIVLVAYFRSTDVLAAGFLATVAVLAAAVVWCSRRGSRGEALAALAACAGAAVVGLFGVGTRLLAPLKDMTPFVAQLDARTPPDEPIYAFGVIDETLRGIVPFVTGRELVPLTDTGIDALRPTFVLEQRKGDDIHTAPLAPPYRVVASRTFGMERAWFVWDRAPEELSHAGVTPLAARRTEHGLAISRR